MWLSGRKDVYLVKQPELYIAIVMVQSDPNSNAFALKRARIMTDHRSFRIALIIRRLSTLLQSCHSYR